MRMSDVHGFNYDGSWGASGLDLWLHHDEALMELELDRGKEYFPTWNVARWWLSEDAYQRNPGRFLAHFESGLALFAARDILVLPVLFNRWRDPVCDFGGVAPDHFLPDVSNWGPSGGLFSRVPSLVKELHANYLGDVVGTHADDPRLLGWDLCNEPLMGAYVVDPDSAMLAAELDWLGWVAAECRRLGATQPMTVGNYPNATATRLTEPFVDFVSYHPYYMPAMPSGGQIPGPDLRSKSGFSAYLDEIVEIGRESGKELLASETVWGAADDAEHVDLIIETLGMLRERELGFTVHALHHSLVADLHSAEFGPVGLPGRLEFINADGSLRAGHDVFNRFA